MIDFNRAFDSAWKRTTVILFEPFDLGKWFIIGFSAFLAGFLEGGNGIHSISTVQNIYNLCHWDIQGGFAFTPNVELQHFQAGMSNAFTGIQFGMLLIFGGIGLIIGLAVAVVIYWLGAHGQFLFLDNIVRNRCEIAWPWRQYARQGHSLFLFYLVFVAISFVILTPVLIVAAVMVIPLLQHQRWPESGEIPEFAVLGLIYLALGLVFSFIIFVFRELGVPLMFRNGLTAYPAFLESLDLVKKHFLSIFLLVLIRLALFIAIAVVSFIACLCCCCTDFPYIGSVFLLPALIYVRCFTLDCLAQFGPAYDVFTVDVAPGFPAVTPPPPLG